MLNQNFYLNLNHSNYIKNYANLQLLLIYLCESYEYYCISHLNEEKGVI